MRGLAILLFFNLLGMVLHSIAHVPLPDSVIGMILFSASLMLGIVKLEWVEQTSSILLRHMLLFFAPIIVGVIPFLPQIRQEWLAVTVSLVGSTITVMLVTGWVAMALGPKRGAQQ